MKKLLRIVLSALGMLLGIGLFIYGAYGPWYPTTLLDLPISLTSGAHYRFDVTPFKTQVYSIEFVFDHLQGDVAESVVPYFVEPNSPIPINATWELWSPSAIAAKGSVADYWYSPFITEEMRGLTVGRFFGEAGTRYSLHIKIRTVDSKWASLAPARIRVEVTSVEYLEGSQLFGVWLICASAIAFCWPVLLRIVGARAGRTKRFEQ